jgi:hypothetical protein
MVSKLAVINLNIVLSCDAFKYLFYMNVGNQRLIYVMHVAYNIMERFPRISHPKQAIFFEIMGNRLDHFL